MKWLCSVKLTVKAAAAVFVDWLPTLEHPLALGPKCSLGCHGDHRVKIEPHG